MNIEESIRKFIVNSPIEKIDHSLLIEKGIRLSVKREDKIHPYISGNKWRKLKYNLIKAHGKTIVTFGGAFSNHIYATAAACKQFGLQSIGVIRGEYDADNPTLKFARSSNMDLHFIDRSSYREKEQSDKVKAVLHELSDYFLIPEGGSNDYALGGLKELTEEINQSDKDIIMVSAGTACTAIGILQGLDPSKELWVFSSLKGEFLKTEILNNVEAEKSNQLKFFSSFHYGGYGKAPIPLIQFVNEFIKSTQIPIDPIYNGKLVSGFFELAKSNKLDSSKSYLWIHTGGLQGIDAYNYIARKKNRPIIENC